MSESDDEILKFDRVTRQVYTGVLPLSREPDPQQLSVLDPLLGVVIPVANGEPEEIELPSYEKEEPWTWTLRTGTVELERALNGWLYDKHATFEYKVFPTANELQGAPKGTMGPKTRQFFSDTVSKNSRGTRMNAVWARTTREIILKGCGYITALKFEVPEGTMEPMPPKLADALESKGNPFVDDQVVSEPWAEVWVTTQLAEPQSALAEKEGILVTTRSYHYDVDVIINALTRARQKKSNKARTKVKLGLWEEDKGKHVELQVELFSKSETILFKSPSESAVSSGDPFIGSDWWTVTAIRDAVGGDDKADGAAANTHTQCVVTLWDKGLKEKSGVSEEEGGDKVEEDALDMKADSE